MQLPPSLRALLGPLEGYLENQAIAEILLPGEGVVRVRSAGRTETAPVLLPAGQVKALASALLSRVQGLERPLPQVAVGLYGELEVTVIERMRDAPPILRIARRVLPGVSLDDLHAAGAIEPAVLEALRAAMAERRSLLITGRRGSGKTELLAAVARELAAEAKVAVLERPEGVLSAAMVGHVRLDPETGVGEALALDAEVLVVDEPKPAVWRALFERGRSFVAALEAGGAAQALSRLTAVLMGQGGEGERARAELLLAGSLERVVETERERAHPRVSALYTVYGVPPRLEPLATAHLSRGPSTVHFGRAPVGFEPPDLEEDEGSPIIPKSSLSARAKAPAGPELGHVASPPLDELADIRAENLVSQSFVMSLDEIAARVEDSSREVRVVSIERAIPPPAITKPVPVPARPVSDEAPEPETAHGVGLALEGELSLEDDPAVSISAEVPVAGFGDEEETRDKDARSTQADLPEPTEEDRPLASEARRVRRQAAERAATVVTDPLAPVARTGPAALSRPATGGGTAREEVSIGPRFEEVPRSADQSWADQEFARVEPADTGEARASAVALAGVVGLDLGPEPAGRPAAPSPGARREALRARGLGDPDSTQSARLDEMLKSPILLGGEDYGAFTTLNPDEPEIRTQAHEGLSAVPSPDGAEVSEGPRRAGGFDEVTPYSPLLNGKKSAPAGAATLEAPGLDGEPLPGRATLADAPLGSEEEGDSIDPVQAARASVEEFDAMLNDIRDVTHHSPFLPDAGETETKNRGKKDGNGALPAGGGAAAKPAGSAPKGRIIGGDAKRRARGPRPE